MNLAVSVTLDRIEQAGKIARQKPIEVDVVAFSKIPDLQRIEAAAKLDRSPAVSSVSGSTAFARGLRGC